MFPCQSREFVVHRSVVRSEGSSDDYWDPIYEPVKSL